MQSSNVCRYGIFSRTKNNIEKNLGGYDKFSRSYENFGMKVQPDNSIQCREWAPGADALFLIGDFSSLNKKKSKIRPTIKSIL